EVGRPRRGRARPGASSVTRVPAERSEAAGAGHRDVRLALPGAFEPAALPAETRVRAAASWKRVTLVGAGALLLGAALTGGAMRMATPTNPRPVTHVEMTLTSHLA